MLLIGLISFISEFPILLIFWVSYLILSISFLIPSIFGKFYSFSYDLFDKLWFYCVTDYSPIPKSFRIVSQSLLQSSNLGLWSYPEDSSNMGCSVSNFSWSFKLYNDFLPDKAVNANRVGFEHFSYRYFNFMSLSLRSFSS